MAWSDRVDRVLRAGLREFGQAVTYTPKGGSPVEITAVFDAAYQLVTLGFDVEIDAVGPVLGVRLGEFEAPPAQGDQVTVAGTAYAVRSVQPDGQGGASLVLRPE